MPACLSRILAGSVLLSFLLLQYPSIAVGQEHQKTKSSNPPVLERGMLPAYPHIAQAANISGRIQVDLTLHKGAIVSLLIGSGNRFLREETERKVKTWVFSSDSDGPCSFAFTYVISGKNVDGPSNPKIEITPTLDVLIVARPVTPSVSE